MDRVSFVTELQNNPGVVIVKYGATWCGPCKKVQPYLNEKKKAFPPKWKYFELDADADSDLFSFLQSKKQVKQIPVIIAYKKGNLTPFADKAIVGSNEQSLDQFFEDLKKL